MDVTKKVILTVALGVLFTSVLPTWVHAAKLFLSPSSGTFTVGSTFDVNIFINTEGQSVNTVSAVLNFPADKLQLVSPTVGQSVINVWTAQPIFNNQTGVIKITGGIPGGINVQSGLVTALTFRVKQVSSSALVKFSDESRVLANDGNGTDVLNSVQNGVYNLILPPPQGPIVSSETHPDQSKWYSRKDVILRWASTSSIETYSYMLDKDPSGVPDDVPEGQNATVTYKNLDDGTHYFHIKSLRDGIWGGITSFGVNIDTQPPAAFKPIFIPSSRTSSKNQIINFQTSDALSGTSYYEIKIISLSPKSPNFSSNNFFIEATSPYQTNLDVGSYDVILRAYDKTGNFREITSRLKVITPIFEIINDQGLRVGGLFVIPWLYVWIILAIVLGLLGLVGWRIERWHHNLDNKRKSRELPADVKSKLETLSIYRKKYGNLVLLICLAGSLLFGQKVHAIDQTKQIQLSPPYISSISQKISNEEIFYVGGKTNEPKVTVIIYLQNLQTGATLNESVISDAKGDWFYRHATFLESGDYVLWTQSKLQDQLSPPSSQVQMSVQKTAIQFGASRFSYELIYLIAAIAFLLVIICLIIFIMYRFWHGRKKHKLFWKEVLEAEESVRRGFAVLKRDIEAELSFIQKSKLGSAISRQLQEKEEHLLKDLGAIQKHIAKEVWDIEQTGHF